MIAVPGSLSAPRMMHRAACAVVCLLAVGGPASSAEPASEAAPAAPSARAVQIAELSGTVSVHDGGDTRWRAAAAERALAPGEGLWTEPAARARLTLGGAALELQERTQLELAALTDIDAELRLVQGALTLSVPKLERGESYQVDTPRGAVRLMLAGRFVIEAGSGDQPTKVTALEGAAQIVGPESGLIVSAGQTGVVTGVDGGLSYAVQQTAAAEAAEPSPAPAPDAAPDAAPSSAPAAAPEPAPEPAPEAGR